MKTIQANGFSSQTILQEALAYPPYSLFILNIIPPIDHMNSRIQQKNIIQEINNKKMIWDIIEQSNFDKHFQNPNLTIEQLLVDENILTQMQNLNPQLLQFINKNLGQVISKLVLYSTIMPREEEGYDRCHRLPYVSSEMLAINSQIFYEAFLPRQGPTTNHLTYLLSFLTSQSASNQLLLGYFEKITNNLYKGRKLEFTKAVSQNLNLFCLNLDKETIGNILKNCVILLGQKQGTLYEERKKIVSTLVTYLVDPNAGNKQKQTQIREVCSMALIQIIGRHKTFSSGDQLLKYLLNSCGQLLIIYSKVDDPQICQFLIGVLNKSTQKIYDPELDDKVSIFRIPPKHQKLLLGYLPLRLHYCQKLVSSGPQKQLLIRQQDGRQVIKVNKQVLDYVTLLAITLQNEIDQFLVESQNYYKFVWQCMCNHPRNDILLTQIDKIFLYAISKRKINKQELNHNLFNRFKIIDKICQVFRNQPQEKVLRPHLFQIWTRLVQFAPQQSKKSNIQWKNICEVYQKLVPLHTKAAGLNYNRPTNAKLVVDQQQAGAVKINQFNVNNHEPQITQLTNQSKQFTQIQKKLDPFDDFSEQMGHQIHKQQTQSQERKEIVQKNSDLRQGQGINKQNPFNQFGDFFNNYQPQSQQIIEQDKKITQKADDFGAFDQFM